MNNEAINVSERQLHVTDVQKSSFLIFNFVLKMYISVGGANCFTFILNLCTLVIGSEL